LIVVTLILDGDCAKKDNLSYIQYLASVIHVNLFSKAIWKESS